MNTGPSTIPATPGASRQGGGGVGPLGATCAVRSRPRCKGGGGRLPIAIALAALAVLGWSLLVRLPVARTPVPAHRAVSPGGRVVSEAEVVAIRAEAAAATARLLAGPGALESHLVQLERDAETAGLKIDFNVLPRTPVPGGPAGLMACPVEVAMVLPPDDAAPGAAYGAVEAWIEAVTRLPVRAEVSRLALSAGPRGLLRGSAELRFFERGRP